MDMNQSLLNKYKKRFRAVKKAEEIENKTLSMQKKLQQLSSLLSLGLGLGFKLKRDGEKIQSNWLLLKT
jgi:predicted PolB exonuclease-like 3'-5' exonuclease